MLCLYSAFTLFSVELTLQSSFWFVLLLVLFRVAYDFVFFLLFLVFNFCAFVGVV